MRHETRLHSIIQCVKALNEHYETPRVLKGYFRSTKNRTELVNTGVHWNIPSCPKMFFYLLPWKEWQCDHHIDNHNQKR